MFLQRPPSDRAMELSLDSRSAPVEEEGNTNRGGVFVRSHPGQRCCSPKPHLCSPYLTDSMWPETSSFVHFAPTRDVKRKGSDHPASGAASTPRDVKNGPQHMASERPCAHTALLA